MDTLAFLNLVFLGCIALVISVSLFKGCFYTSFIFYLPIALGLHFFFAYLYWVTVGYDSDSTRYFYNAQPYFGFNTEFAQFICWYMRDFFWGDSYLSAFFFSSVLSYFADLLYVLSFFEILKRLEIKIDIRLLFFPLFLFLFWPSHLYFSMGLIKDSGAYFCIALLTYTLLSFRSHSGIKLILLVFALTLAFIIRPYFVVILFFASCLSFFFSKQMSLAKRSLILLILALLLFLASGLLLKMGHLNVASLEAIGGRFVKNQVDQATGTSIPVPTTDPLLTFLFLPYLFLANLFLPLFIFANNFSGILASFENLIFIYICYLGIKHRQYWTVLKQKMPALSFLFYFSLSGLGFMSLINTNLGLAMRQKTMYVPILFLVICSLIFLSKLKSGERQ